MSFIAPGPKRGGVAHFNLGILDRSLAFDWAESVILNCFTATQETYGEADARFIKKSWAIT